MVTPHGKTPTRAERAAIWMLCRLLPEGFRARQHAEWTGDLIAMSGSGAGARRRYLLAAAWTLPALRAHARKPGVDRPHAIVPPTVPVTTLVRLILIGLGLPVLSWLIAIPTRYYLLDVPGRIAGSMPFDPKELWPMDGPFIVLVPLWVALMLGAWAVIFSSMLLTWIGLTAAVLAAAERRADRRFREILGIAGLVVVVAGIANGYVGLLQVSDSPVDRGLASAGLGAVAVLVGFGARGLTRRRRAIVVLTGLAAIAIFAWHQTPTGEAMLNWHLD